MTYIKPGAVFVSCDPRDSIRIRVTAYMPGHARAHVVDASTGKRPRQVLVSSLHESPTTERGARRRTGYALAGADQQTPPAASAAEQQPAADWFDVMADVPGAMPGRRFTVSLPPRLLLLNSNQRLNRYTTADITKVLRRAAWAAANHIPPMERAHIIGVLHPENRQRRDAANWYPSFKACIDGLVDRGVLPDDDHTRLLGPDMRIGHIVEGSRLVLHIRELEPARVRL